MTAAICTAIAIGVNIEKAIYRPIVSAPLGSPARTEVGPKTQPFLPIVNLIGANHGATPKMNVKEFAGCTSASLKGTYWTSLPAMSVDLSGITITNVGNLPCALPLSISAAAITGPNGARLRSTKFIAPSPMPMQPAADQQTEPVGSTPSSLPEFENVAVVPNYGGGAWLDAESLIANIHVATLTLTPRGEAVLVIYTVAPPSPSHASCISVPVGGSIRIEVGAQSVIVPVPSMPAPSGGNQNTTGSAFYECSTGLVTPFLTWDEAAQIVGPSGSNNGRLASRNDSVLNLAP